MSKEFWKAALNRAIRTVAQTLLASIPAGVAVSIKDIGIDTLWVILSWLATGIVAGVVSVLTSIATGLPEVPVEEQKPPDKEPNITVRAYDDYYEDGSPKRLGDVVFSPPVGCDGDTCDLTPYLVEDGGADDADP